MFRLIHDVIESGVAVVKGRAWSEGDQVRLARGLGAIELQRASPGLGRRDIFRVSTAAGHGRTGVGYYWHKDGCTRDPPIDVAIYCIRKMPKYGGNTEFVDAQDAWKSLDPIRKNELSQMTWIHPSGCIHPFVSRHSITNEDTLCINLGKGIDVCPGKGADWLTISEYLKLHLENAPRYSHAWRLGDILVVDNHRVIHRATAASGDRVLDRVSVVRLRSSILAQLRAEFQSANFEV